MVDQFIYSFFNQLELAVCNHAFKYTKIARQAKN